ncbi:hypothetical protein [Virgibacillus ainsalahensis]
MSFTFADLKKWRKARNEGFITAVTGLILLVIDASVQESIWPVLVIIALLGSIVGAFRGIHYMKLPEKDYIRIKGDYISIYHAFFLPRKEFSFHDMESYTQVSTLIYLHFKDGKEEQLHIDWLSKESLEELRAILYTKIVAEKKA